MKIKDLIKKEDERGFMMELYREDWVADKVKQSMLSVAKAGTLKAWHAHSYQDDLLVVVSGEAVIVYYDQVEREFMEFRVSGKKPQLIGITGSNWHGMLSLTDTNTIYFINRLYNYDDPDELRHDPDIKFSNENDEWMAYNWGKWLVDGQT